MKRKYLWKTIINCYKEPRLLFLLHRKWYYYFDFGNNVEVCSNKKNNQNSGFNNWDNFLCKHLPPFDSKRILDIGCNAGIYTFRMADAKAKEVVGIDRSIVQAEYVKSWFIQNGKDYSSVKFVKADVAKYRLQNLGNFDFVCMFCVAYHLREYADRVMKQLSDITPAVALQGNLRRLTHSKYNCKPYYELGGVEGMKNLLIKHGFDRINVISPEGHKKPLVIGSSI